ncbi:MAG: hypothetical protein ACO1PB_01805 [Ramlibacter sp.]
MEDNHPQLARIEQLLHEGNQLRRESIALQKSLVDEQRAILGKAQQVNDQALAIQVRARRIQGFAIPALVVLVAYASYLLVWGIAR